MIFRTLRRLCFYCACTSILNSSYCLNTWHEVVCGQQQRNVVPCVFKIGEMLDSMHVPGEGFLIAAEVMVVITKLYLTQLERKPVYEFVPGCQY
jgi:hypothetical protein